MKDLKSIKTSKDYVFIHDVEEGNPNGDPKNNNLPRELSTGNLIVSDVSIKRKIRNYREAQGDNIFIKPGNSLNSKLKSNKGSTIVERNDNINKEYWDNRVFGVVANTGDKDSGTDDVKIASGTTHGPIQIFHSKSINKPFTHNAQITRCVSTKENNNHTMGNKIFTEYALFKGSAVLDANRAEKSGMTIEDEEKFLDGLQNAFTNHASNSSGIQTMRKIYVFEHPAGKEKQQHITFREAVKVTVKKGVVDPESFDDFEIILDKTKIPKDVFVKEINLA